MVNITKKLGKVKLQTSTPPTSDLLPNLTSKHTEHTEINHRNLHVLRTQQLFEKKKTAIDENKTETIGVQRLHSLQTITATVYPINLLHFTPVHQTNAVYGNIHPENPNL